MPENRGKYARRFKKGILRLLKRWVAVKSGVCVPQFGLGRGTTPKIWRQFLSNSVAERLLYGCSEIFKGLIALGVKCIGIINYTKV
jgi:hypothetical protein